MKVQKSYEDKVRNAQTPADLVDVLQHVFKLEHATVHPYLTAIFSLKHGTNAEVQQHIRWVAMEEMLHMCIVGNLIVALGGSPIIDDPSLIPPYPCPLPMGVNHDLVITLEKYSPEQARNVFMGIERPEDPVSFEDDTAPEVQSESTIGRLYHHVAKKLAEFGTLPGNPAPQVTAVDPYTADELFAIRTTDDALKAIEIIVEQGEGTTSSPVSPSAKMAHYYRFEELAEGRRLVPDDSAENGYSFTGEPIDYSPDGVWNIAPNTKLDDLPSGSDERELAEKFARSYTSMMKTLHRAFNGHPDEIGDAIDEMKDLQKVGYKLCATPFPGRDGVYIGPTWEYLS